MLITRGEPLYILLTVINKMIITKGGDKMEEVEYKDIVGYEKDVLDTFFRVVNEAGPYDGIFDYRTYAD